MKRLLVAFMAFFLVGCTTETPNTAEPVAEAKPTRPSYLAIERAYEASPLAAACEAFEEDIRDAKHPDRGSIPYKTVATMDITQTSENSDAYVYALSCEVTAYYQFNALAYFNDTFDQPLGELRIPK